MDSSSGFGSTPCDWTLISNSLSLRLPYSVKLATECKSLTHYAKGTQSPLVRLLLFVCMRFQVLFHSPPGVLFAFPSRYWFTIGLSGVFSLAGWSRRIRSGLHVSRLTQESAMIHKLACTGLSPSVITFSKVFHFIYFINVAVLLPRYCRNNNGLGLSPVARRYWGNHVCFLLLQVLRCFSSLRLPTLRYNMSSTYWVIPFGDLRIKGYLHLNGAFRSLSRPSSPLRA